MVHRTPRSFWIKDLKSRVADPTGGVEPDPDPNLGKTTVAGSGPCET